MNRNTKKKFNNIIPYIMLYLLILGIAILAYLLINQGEAPQGALPPSSLQDSSSQAPSSQEPPLPSTVSLVGVGDNLIHEGIYEQASDRAAGEGYDFTYAYENIAPWIQKADIASINQETVMAESFPLSAYPMFNSPTALGKHMTGIGFDVMNLANNHVFDKGETGLRETLGFWGTQPVQTTGAYLNRADFQKLRTITENGITFGFVGMTELTNGLSLPEDTELILLQLDEEEEIRDQIERAKAVSDIVVVNVHWGVEYTHEPNETQRAMAQKMVDWGADIILGHHPHVIQPVEYLTRADGTRAVVAYSLGNFISQQSEGSRMIGGMLNVSVTKDHQTNQTQIDSVKFTPLVTHYERGFDNTRTYLLSQYTDELALSHGVRAYSPGFDLEYIQETVHAVIDPEFLAD